MVRMPNVLRLYEQEKRLYEEATEFSKANEATDWPGTDYYEAVDAWGGQMLNNLMALMAKAKVAGVRP